MSIPHCFDPLIGAKPKHPWVGTLSQTAPPPVDEIAPPSQIPGLNLTQFNNIGTFRPNVAQHIPKPSTRVCRARNLFNWSSDQLSCLPHIPKQGQLFITWHELSSVIPSSPYSQKVWISVATCSHVSGLIATSFHTPHMTLIKDQTTFHKGVKISLHSSSLIQTVSSPFPL